MKEKLQYIPIKTSLTWYRSHGHSFLQERLGNVALNSDSFAALLSIFMYERRENTNKS